MVSRFRRSPLFGVLVVVLLLAGVLGGVAVGQIAVDEFSGCLSTNGNLNKVAVGDTPASPCKSNQQQVTWNAEGPQGDPGPAGPPGVVGYYRNFGASGGALEGEWISEDALCDPGDPVTGGGYSISGEMSVKGSHPITDQGDPSPGWHVDGWAGAPSGSVTVWAMCADLSSP